MKAKDIAVEFPGICIIHQKIRGHSVEDHQHEEHEFFLPLQGEIQVQLSGQGTSPLLKAGPGKMIYLPPQSPHSFRGDTQSQGERLILIVSAAAWKKRAGGTFGPLVIAASQLCQEILFQLLIYPKTKAAPALTETLIQTLSEMLENGNTPLHADFLHVAGQCQDPRVRKALEFMEENVSTAVTIEKIARTAGMSVRNFNRLFLNELGRTPKEVSTLLRIEQAKHLLGQGRTTVTDVAFLVGYNSVSQFISAFRKTTGQLPSSLLPR